jgi:CHAT domain-containing protein
LSTLPLATLPTEDGDRLIDRYQIGYVSTGRDVLRFNAPFTQEARSPVVIADPNFDLAVDDECAAESPAESLTLRELTRGGWQFDPLPGTRREGESVAALLDVEAWLANDAVESRIKECRSPRILHMATHGFFIEEAVDKDAKTVAVSPDREDRHRLLGIPAGNPLLRSGLALAAANTWLRRASVPALAEDGLLTAEDATALDLRGTQMVVLSACDTGLGEIRIGEGIMGLRRAFVLAGARAIIVSTWKVPDDQTQELMTEFYQRALAGEGIAESLRRAQLAMKARYPDPLYWGAFICQGDPGPLPS